ncbi:hypothetical protein HMPREF0591_4975 [Mycobacterium parascrofulaceum ATCC BAA-614]|uniref:Uncharacterized protein n=1 Tax=Mycobacterium parascrofulaceum ATCC BAA-614 TaxID=525368 RepID=D5PFN1_9MYCO|nr:hypothetical protein HMPREF0591_4975 [Mycobacterium parascrofulaceum ATCC BAA-614]
MLDGRTTLTGGVSDGSEIRRMGVCISFATGKRLRYSVIESLSRT